MLRIEGIDPGIENLQPCVVRITKNADTTAMLGARLMEIQEVPFTEAPIELLLEADPSREKLNSYLPHSTCFVGIREGAVVGAYVVQSIAPETYELMSIAVAPELQQKGIGTDLLRHAIATVSKLGARRLELGTGTFGYQLAWYQRLGFRVFGIERDFFLENYPDPIFENGIQLKDMLRLSIEYEPRQ